MKKLFCFLVLLALTSCGPNERSIFENPLAVGVKITGTAMGYEFEEEVMEVEGNSSLWETRWKNQIVSKSRLYWGLYPLEIHEEKSSFINDFDTSKIDELFPLSIGKEVLFSGITRRIGIQSLESPIWVNIRVREKTTLEIKSGEREVFILDIITDKTTSSGVIKEYKTVWFSEEIGVVLKRETKIKDQVYGFRVLDISIPDTQVDQDGRRRNLGTIII